MINILHLFNLSEEDIEHINAISKNTMMNDDLIVINNINNDTINFHLVVNGDWWCNITDIPSISFEIINELVNIAECLSSSYGLICGSYQALMDDFTNRLRA